MESVKEVSKGIILEIRAKPNSNQTKLYKKDRIYILEIQSEPKNNKANLEIISCLTKLFNRNVKILRGLKSRNKTVFVENMKEKEFEELFPAFKSAP